MHMYMCMPMHMLSCACNMLYMLYMLSCTTPRRYDGTWRGCIDEQPLQSLAQLRAAVAAGAPSDGFAFGLEHYEELQEPDRVRVTAWP